jgi:hypothetical protein
MRQSVPKSHTNEESYEIWEDGKAWPQAVGPFEILKRIGLVAYQVALPSNILGIHNVFYVSMPQKYVPDPSQMLFFLYK